MTNSTDIHRRITLNSLANLLRYTVYVVVTFIMTPYTIRKLGMDNYGLWVLVLAIVGYSGLLEMGVQTSVVKLVAQKNAANELDGLQRIVSTAYAFFQGVGLLVACVLILVVPFFIPAMVASSKEQETMRLLFMILGINAAICFPAYVLGGVIYGMQRYVAKSGLEVFFSIANAALIYLVLEQGMGIVGLAIVKTVIDVAGIAALFLLTKKILPVLKIRLGEVTFSSFRELFSLGGKIFISSITNRIADNTESVLISVILSNTWTTVFSIPKRLVDYIKEISVTATASFMPMFSDFDGRGDIAQIVKLYEQYSRYILIIIVPFISSIMVLGVPFISLWIGDELATKGGNLVSYLSVTFLIDSLQPLGWRLMIGVGKIDFMVKVSVCLSVGYLALAALLVNILGIEGIGIAAMVIAVINQVCYLPYICRFLGISPIKHLVDCQFRSLFGWGIFTILLFVLARSIGTGTYLQILVIPTIGFALYGIVAYYALLLPAERIFFAKTLKLKMLQIWAFL